MWSEGRRAFKFGRLSSDPSNDTGFTELVAYDLDALEEVGRVPLSPRGYAGKSPDEWYGYGQNHVGAVDPSTGRIFLAYETMPQSSVTSVANPANPFDPTGKDKILKAPPAPGSPPCTLHIGHSPCLGGIHVIDAKALQTTRSIPFSGLSVDAAVMEALPRAMAYAPPVDGIGDASGKVLLLVEELQHNRFEGTGVTSGTENTIPRRNGAALYYAMQIDPDRGVADWTVRVEGCRNSRENRAGNWARNPNPAVIFRSGGESPALWIGCHSPNSAGTVVKIPLDERGFPFVTPVRAGDPVGAVAEGAEAGQPPPSGSVASQNPSQQTVIGPDRTLELHADPQSQRILMRVEDNAEVWWVFDGKVNGFVGTVGIGGFTPDETTSAFDPLLGRLYVLGPELAGDQRAASSGGLFVADIRRSPVSQALVFPEFAGLATSGVHLRPMAVDRVSPEQPARLLVPTGDGYAVLEDALPGPASVEPEDFEGRTLDIPEVPGVTETAFDGAARGYGARIIMTGGAEAMARVGPADPVGVARGLQDLDPSKAANLGPTGTALNGVMRTFVPASSGCHEASREIVLASVGPESPAILEPGGARGTVQPVVIDSGTNADLQSLISRCGAVEWDSIWQTALFGRAPLDEPTVTEMLEAVPRNGAECLSTGREPTATVGDSTTKSFSGRVECEDQGVAGWSQVRGVDAEGLSLGNLISSFTVYRDPGRGLVSRVESVVRGVRIDTVISIDTVRAVAESWANGRRQFVPDGERGADYDPNCDFGRTAGTCFQRHVFGVRTPRWSCGPCGDEQALAAGLSRALGANGSVRLRQPDPRLARGSENGFIAAVQKSDHERFGDLVLNGDLLQTVIPALEIIRQAPQGRPSVGVNFPLGLGARGRQIYQFAGVEVSSSYGIQCLLVYDEATNTCAEAAEPPGSITVSLADADGKPLAGGAFEVRQDVDADGVLGLKDTLLPNGACVTTDDGVGTCGFESLVPGPYVVSQVAAPPGYAKSAEPFLVELASGEARTVTFTNVRDLSSIELKATDEHGAPLVGAAFVAYPDHDADGKVAPDAKPAAECTTDARGACSMRVPSGSYVLVQTSAPGGLAVIEPVPFTFASGGQVAAVTVVNYPPDSPPRLDAPAPPPVYTPPMVTAPPIESVDTDYTPSVSEPEVAPGASLGEQVGGTVVQVIRAPGDALRLLSREPKQAVAWIAAIALFCLAALAIRRRQQAVGLIHLTVGDKE